jgi:fatty acid synthase subunit alpha
VLIAVFCWILLLSQLFRQRISGIASRTRPGEGIHVNLLYLNPFLWTMLYPLTLKLKKEEGFNIECITIAAGVPSLEKSSEICSQMLEAGITKLGFKPGTVSAIQAVVAIAHANPRMKIILQWTGGRSGGHHSQEDAHFPLLSTYPLIRTASNIILVFGGGLGDAASALPYLTGTWSLPFFKPPFPVDALLFGSRIMVALEAPTSPAAKKLIVETPGVTNEKEWEQSLTGIAGGVVTVQSELGGLSDTASSPRSCEEHLCLTVFDVFAAVLFPSCDQSPSTRSPPAASSSGANWTKNSSPSRTKRSSRLPLPRTRTTSSRG